METHADEADVPPFTPPIDDKEGVQDGHGFSTTPHNQVGLPHGSPSSMEAQRTTMEVEAVVRETGFHITRQCSENPSGEE